MSISSLSEFSLTTTSILLPSTKGSIYPLSSKSKPLEGSSIPIGGSRKTSSPSSFISLSVIGLKSSFPDMAIAATISGDETKA